MRTPLRGFSLVELLAAASLLLILLTAVVQLLNLTNHAVSQSSRRLLSDNEARVVFDRMALDFARVLQRQDVDYVFARQEGNDAAYFYSEAPGFTAASPLAQSAVSLVGYRINPAFQLERFGKALTWDGAAADGVVFLTYADRPVRAGSAPLFASTIGGAFETVIEAGSSDTHYHVLSPDVFRLEFNFLLKPRVASDGSQLPSVYSNVPWDSRAGRTGLTGVGLADVRAVVVTLGILNGESRRIISSPNGISELADHFADPTNDELRTTPAKLPAQTWQDQVDVGPNAFGGIPPSASNQIRIYQRNFPLTSP